MNTNDVLRTYLLNQSDVTDLVGARVYCPRSPQDSDLTNATIIFSRVGGTSELHTTLRKPTFRFWCYAATERAAAELYEALYGVLQGINNTAVVIGAVTARIFAAVESTGPQDMVDELGEDTGWPYVLGMFQVTIGFPII